MADEPKQNRDNPGVLVGILVAAACVLLRMCDTASEAESARALAGSGLGGSGGSIAVAPYLLYIAIGAAIVFAIARAFLVPGLALLIVIIAAMVATVLVYSSTAEIARRRSHAIDSWSLCEKPGMSPRGYSVYVSQHRTSTSSAGPHLTGGDPCVEESERRDVHVREYPDGNFVDGVQQIMYRFPRDRKRVVYVPAVLIIGLVVAVVLTIVHERRQR